MTPKARMIAALEHREPDRVPTGESHIMFGFAESVLGYPTLYRNPWGELQAVWEGRRDEIVKGYSEDYIALVRKLELDFLAVRPVPARRQKYAKPAMLGPYTWRDERGRVLQYSPQTGTMIRTMKEVDMSIDDIVMPPDPAPVDESCFESIERVIKELGGTHLILARCSDGAFPRHTVGFEEFLMRMVTQPEFVLKAAEAYTRQALAEINALCDMGVDGVWVGSDYCDNRGPFMGLKLWRQFVKPFLKREVDAAHAKGKWFILHNCGNNWPILDDLVEIGIDAYQAIQPRIHDMRLLKEKYGDKLALFGGVDDDTLVRGSVQDVVEEVKYAIKHAARGGGFALGSSNTIVNSVKAENYRAMLQANRDFGRYPISL